MKLLKIFHRFVKDYHWWWRSYLTGACTALYLFLYSIYYFHKLTIVGTTSTVLYFGYTSIIVILFFLYTGKTEYCDWRFFNTMQFYTKLCWFPSGCKILFKVWIYSVLRAEYCVWCHSWFRLEIILAVDIWNAYLITNHVANFYRVCP